MEFVINEWFPEYLRPDATDEERQKVARFIKTLLERDDVRIAVRRPSQFLKKLLRFEKDFPNDLLALRRVKVVNSQIILNSDKCRIIDDDQFEPIPDSLANLLNVGNYASDIYLFEAAYTIANERIIVTTDIRLIEHVGDKALCQLVHLDDFLRTF